MASETYSFTIVHGASLPSQPWWPQLHSVIIESFLSKDYSLFPPTWTRLDPDIAKGAEGLAHELGDNGHIAVALAGNDMPVACGGVLPFRGENWINDVNKKSDLALANGERAGVQGSDGPNTGSTADWEICCFCVHPSYRRHGLSYRLLDALIDFIRLKGGNRLLANYAINETGNFWRRLGFEVIPGAGGMLPKGFQTDTEKEGLRAPIYFNVGVKRL